MADALATVISKGESMVCSSCCPISRYFACLSHDKLPFCPQLHFKNTSKLLLCTLILLISLRCRAQTAQRGNKTKAKPQRPWLWEEEWLENSPCRPQAGGDAAGGVCCLTSCSSSTGSGGVPARNEFHGSEMLLIRQESFASESFPWGSYSGAIYS